MYYIDITSNFFAKGVLDYIQKVKENDVAKLLQMIGYDVSNLNAASYAFCRHFIPEVVQVIDDKDVLIENVYPKDFVFPDKYLPVLKACANRYNKR